MTAFKIGDRVTRPTNVFQPNSPIKHGTITHKYSSWGGINGCIWFDPELYSVQWDDGSVGKAYFRHGLDAEPATSRSKAL